MVSSPTRLALALLVGAGLGVGWMQWLGVGRPAPPASSAAANGRSALPEQAEDREPSSGAADGALVQRLLAEDLPGRTFAFATVVRASAGKEVLPLQPLGEAPAHRRVVEALQTALAETLPALSRPDSPVRRLRRINEASRYLEEDLRRRIDAMPGLRCEVPPTRAGGRQRAGYPDLRITDEASGLVFYVDPKLMERGSSAGSLRTFYFEPKTETLKITEDAVHLLVGIEHDGRAGEWTFTGWRLVDLSTLRVRLKAEFQASNADLYRETELSLPGPPD